MKEFITNNAFNIGALLVGVVIAWVTIQANSEDIIALQNKHKELEEHKVSNSTMILKEQFLQSELQRIEAEIKDLNSRLDKKIKIINELEEEIQCYSIQTQVQEQRLKQNEGELNNLWKFTNKFLEEL
jgi:capsule polysaccharide export protein KpsE/RkpR